MTHGYFAFEGFENELESEIKFKMKKQAAQKGRLFLFEGSGNDSKLADVNLVWAQLRFPNLQSHSFESISKAAKFLREQNRYWAAYSFQLHRRTELIQEQLKAPKEKLFGFQEDMVNRDWGFWCLQDEKTLFYTPKTGSALPLGEIKFQEDKIRPPSRAYLKLWEAFTVHVDPPGKNEVVLDLGSCPGGWTWVLQTLGCHVISVDTAPLDDKVSKLPNIQFVKKDAFKLDPKSVTKPNWLFSDIICEPQRLYDLVQTWLQVYPDLKCLCTIKYKGQTDFKTTALFEKIPGSQVFHLNHNKHEVTWLLK